MEKQEEKQKFVNTPMDMELVEKLDKMREQNSEGEPISRAQFIRLLVRRKWNEFQKTNKSANERNKN